MPLTWQRRVQLRHRQPTRQQRHAVRTLAGGRSRRWGWLSPRRGQGQEQMRPTCAGSRGQGGNAALEYSGWGVGRELRGQRSCRAVAPYKATSRSCKPDLKVPICCPAQPNQIAPEVCASLVRQLQLRAQSLGCGSQPKAARVAGQGVVIQSSMPSAQVHSPACACATNIKGKNSPVRRVLT